MCPDSPPAPALGPTLAARVAAWIADDPDPRTAADLAALLQTAGGVGAAAATAAADLADRFSGPLEFGTAGLRGRIGGGQTRMNRAVVIRAAAGLTAYLAEILAGRVAGGGDDGDDGGGGATAAGGPVVVIGYDARHLSDVFALDTAAVVTAAGGSALLLPTALPTPVLAFAVRHLGADAGVMVTASHNPPADNGYKVYLGGRVEPEAGRGAQIVPPADDQIAARIAAVGAVRDVPRATAGWRALGGSLVEAYLDRVARLVDPGTPRGLRIVLTPLHGVGGALAVRALVRAGFTDVHLVAEQAEPDPDFPTVDFPNPEEPGALDLAIATARRLDADLILATDPDADRCAAAVPDPRVPGGWRPLSGDEVGVLLGERAAVAAEATGGGGVLACSIVSSRLLALIADAHGLAHRTTLTGFKWIARVPGLVYGYEEALGYCVDPDAVRDKDGIGAALCIAAVAATRKAAGSDLLTALDDLAAAHGVHATAPLSIRVSDQSLIGAAMSRLRGCPPTSLGGSRVTQAVDLSTGFADLPPTDGLLYVTEVGDRVVVRPSGTEPKLKCYLEAVVPVTAGDVATARATAAHRLADLQADLLTALGL